jgi:hypothetical protein
MISVLEHDDVHFVPCFLEAQDFPVNVLADTSNIHAIKNSQ